MTVQKWACSACGWGDASWWFSNRCCSFAETLIPHVSDFIFSPHFPCKSLIRLLLRHIVVGRLTCTTPCRHIMPVPWLLGHILRTARSSVHSLAGKSGGRILRWRRPCVPWQDLSVHSRARVLLENGLGWVSSRPYRRQVSCSAAALQPSGRYGGHRLAARRRSSARRAEAVIGSPRGGGNRLAARRQSSARRAEAVIGSPRGGWASASMLLARLCVLWDDRNGSSRPAGPGDALTRTELTSSAGI